MTKLSDTPCELLSWDTEFFGYRIGRILGDTLEERGAAEIDRWSQTNRVQTLYFLARADAPFTFETAQRHSFGLVDIRVTLELNPLTAFGAADPGSQIRPFEPADITILRAIARTAHSDARFFSDPRFPRYRAEDFYETWIALECQGRAQTVLVATDVESMPVGYISCLIDRARNVGQIGLVGVSRETRGKGIGKKLILSGLQWFKGQGLNRVEVVTQGRNIAAQRLYQRFGFLTLNVQLWFHKWYFLPTDAGSQLAHSLRTIS